MFSHERVHAAIGNFPSIRNLPVMLSILQSAFPAFATLRQFVHRAVADQAIDVYRRCRVVLLNRPAAMSRAPFPAAHTAAGDGKKWTGHTATSQFLFRRRPRRPTPFPTRVSGDPRKWILPAVLALRAPRAGGSGKWIGDSGRGVIEKSDSEQNIDANEHQPFQPVRLAVECQSSGQVDR